MTAYEICEKLAKLFPEETRDDVDPCVPVERFSEVFELAIAAKKIVPGPVVRLSCENKMVLQMSKKTGKTTGKTTKTSLTLNEGMVKKGGVNKKPTTPRPPPPKGQGGSNAVVEDDEGLDEAEL